MPLAEHVQVQEFVGCCWLEHKLASEEFQDAIRSQAGLQFVYMWKEHAYGPLSGEG